MAIDRKYGIVQLERGTVADDEPVFVLRAKDRLAATVIEHYALLCRYAGSPDAHVDGVMESASQVRAWQDDHHTQTPVSAPGA